VPPFCSAYLIHDRDPLFTAEFLNILAETGVASVRIPSCGASKSRVSNG
jgi:hypothetical protein